MIEQLNHLSSHTKQHSSTTHRDEPRHKLVLLVSYLIVFILFGCCAWMIVDTLIQYFSFCVSTTTRRLYDTRPPFPTITICPTNAFNSDSAVKILQDYNINMSLFRKREATKNTEILAKLNMTSFYHTMRNVTNWSLMLWSCMFADLPCETSNFTLLEHPLYINCLRFNADGARTVSQSGDHSSLRLLLYTGLPDFISQYVPVGRSFQVVIQFIVRKQNSLGVLLLLLLLLDHSKNRKKGHKNSFPKTEPHTISRGIYFFQNVFQNVFKKLLKKLFLSWFYYFSTIFRKKPSEILTIFNLTIYVR